MEIDVLILLKLKEHYKITIITNNNNIDNFYKKNWFEVINLWKLNIKINNNLDYFIEKYWFISPEESLWQREIKIYWVDKKYLEKSSLEYFNFFEDYFKNYKWILIHNWDHYFHLIAEKVAKFYNIQVIYHNSIWTLENKIVFTDSWLYNDYNNQKYLNDNINSKDKQRIEEFIITKLEKKPLIWWKRYFILFSHIFKFFKYFKNYIFIWKYRKDYKFPLSFVKDFLFKIKNVTFNKIKYDNITVVNKKSIFFPMHVIDDAQTTTREYKYIDQLKLVKKLWKIIPEWYNLVIKEHPHWVGMMNMKLFYNLKNKYKNFYILDPRDNAYEIIKRSFAVLTINSDVWYESIIMWKKTLTIWKSFYTWYWYNIAIDLENTTKEWFLKILKNSNFNISMDERIKFIYSLEKVHKEWTFFKNSKLEFNLDDDTISKLSLYIKKIIENES